MRDISPSSLFSNTAQEPNCAANLVKAYEALSPRAIHLHGLRRFFPLFWRQRSVYSGCEVPLSFFSRRASSRRTETADRDGPRVPRTKSNGLNGLTLRKSRLARSVCADGYGTAKFYTRNSRACVNRCAAQYSSMVRDARISFEERRLSSSINADSVVSSRIAFAVFARFDRCY